MTQLKFNWEKMFVKLKAEFDQYKKESVKWSAIDFIERGKEIGYLISTEKAQEALENMIRKHDATLGISWTTIDVWLEKYGTPIKKKIIINKF